jgi:uncharacterized membrane protein
MEEIQELNEKELRKFGLVTGSIVAVLFGLFLPWLFNHGLPVWPWIIAGILGVWAMILPATLAPVYKGWMRIGMAVGWFNTRLILGILFFVIFTPIGLIMRLFGHDSMQKDFDKNAKTYRISLLQKTPDDMERPF